MTKCSHDACKNDVCEGSTYCNRCIQLPTKLCNFCNTEGFEYHYDAKHTLLIDIIAELIVCLPLSAFITVGLLVWYIIIEVAMGVQWYLSSDKIIALWLISYLLLFCWVRIGSMKIKWRE